MLMVLVREVSPTIGNCQLTFMERQSIDYERARMQHRNYRNLLQSLGLNVIFLPIQSDLPDAVFVEDTAVILDELAIICLPALESRRRELESTIDILQRYRALRFLGPPATLEGGDIILQDRILYAGISTRTNLEGIRQLSLIAAPLGYEVRQVKVCDCLHLSTGASYLGRNTVLLNPDWVDVTAFQGSQIIDVPKSEPWAANVVRVGDQLVMPATFPETRALLEHRGFFVHSADVSELLKAEAGVTCMTLIFEAAAQDRVKAAHHSGARNRVADGTAVVKSIG